MVPHPDFAEVDLPRSFELGPFHFTPLGPDQVDEDLKAVLETAPLLAGIFGSWPEGLTREKNLIDLAWHDREFTARRSFSWILRDGTGAYIGCVYLFPKIGARGRARLAFWLCDLPDRENTALELRRVLEPWLDKVLPPGITLEWTSRP